jgi:putative ABC transport system substrate-binding protein
MLGASDPVGAGLVASLARPGGNVTGIADYQLDLVPKRLELLRAAAPRVSRVVNLHGQYGAFPPSTLDAINAERSRATRALGLTLLDIEMRAPQDFQEATAAIVRERPDALLLGPNPTNFIVRKELAEFAVKHRLPTIGGPRETAAAGALMSYGSDTSDLFRKAAVFVDKILKGAKPADLPVEQPTKFEFVINLKTAKALGLSIPPSLVGRADEVIQ